MITLTQYAQFLETALNDTLNNPNIKFIVFSDIGNYKAAWRKSNSVTVYINCLLSREPGTIITGNNGLQIASDNITLQVAVPTDPPRRTVDEEPDWNSYAFAESIRNLMDNYFSKNRIQAFTDETGVTYETGMIYSFSETGDSEIAPIIDEYIEFSVYITVNMVQNGINSRSTQVEIDGEAIPFLTAQPSRAEAVSGDVYSDNSNCESENVVISTTFAVDVSTPATTGMITSQFSRFLLEGKPNVAHFMKLVFGDDSRLALVTYGNVNANMDGARNVGTSIPFILVAGNPYILNFPGYFTAAKIVNITPGTTVTVTFSLACLVSIGTTSLSRYLGELDIAGMTLTFENIPEDELAYDEENDTYYLCVLACPTGEKTQKVTITATGGTVAVID